MNVSAQRKVRFIEPAGRAGRPFNAWISRWPLLGPITLATILKNAGYDAAVYNENICGSVLDDGAAYEDIRSADLVGISIMTPTANRGYAIADRLRRDRPDVRIAMGGVHATFCPQEAARHADIVVRGEGETVIKAIAAGRIAPGVIRAEPLADLDSLPTLDHSLMIGFDRLLARCRRRELYELPIMTSRGCPHACTYCSVTRMFGRKVRRQSVDKVYRDIRSYADRGFRHVFFYDDNLTADRRWARELLGRIRPLGLRFNAQTRVDFHWQNRTRRRPDQELLELMRSAGADVLYIGYETIDESTADAWHKDYRGAGTLEDRLLEDTDILHRHGFWIHGMFIVGPQHGEQTSEQIVRFAQASRLESMQISVLTPFPGTPMFREMSPHLLFRRFPQDWNYYDGAHCVFDHGRMEPDRLQENVLAAHRRFYRRLGWALRQCVALMRQPIPLGEKIAQLISHSRIARKVMREWRKETRSFLELVRSRLQTRNLPLQTPSC